MPAPNQYIVGTMVNMTTTFTDSTGVLVDPATVTGELMPPGGADVVILTPVRISLGIWQMSYEVETPGVHQYRMVGTGAVSAAGEGNFTAVTQFPGG